MAAVLVTVIRSEGSAPREVGAAMLVRAGGIEGSIGGGRLEFDAIARARTALAGGGHLPAEAQRYALGPSLGQCCAGVVWLRFDWADALPAPAPLFELALFGAGHVGRAIVALLASLPVKVLWVDSRDEIFPGGLPPQVRTEHSDPVQAAVQDLTPGSEVLIMSYSHAEDLDIVAACLMRQRERGDLPFIGLIGSKSKWATFRHRLEERGFKAAELAHIRCPIGVAGIVGKQPAVIAVAVVAQLLGRERTEPPA